VDRQAVLVREVEIALVVRRHAHHGALAVAHENVVADPDGQASRRHGMRYGEAGRHALSFDLRELRLDHGSALALLDEVPELRVL
jgi:hypothetical protein